MKIIDKFKKTFFYNIISNGLGIVFNFINKFKETFFYNFMSSGLGIAFIIFAAFIIIFHDFSCDKKVVKMKEDVMYIKPSTNIDDKK